MMVMNESVAADIAAMIETLNEVRTLVLAGRAEDLGIASLKTNGMIGESALGMIANRIGALYSKLRVYGPQHDVCPYCSERHAALFDCKEEAIDQPRTCAVATANKVAVFPQNGVTVEEA